MDLAEKKNELSTEEKILEAARKVFMEKGYAGARTRDIAKEADINLALLNYHFRSKKKLFEQIVYEKVVQLFGAVLPIFIDDEMDVKEKTEKIVNIYTDLLMENPDLPIFVLSEIRSNPTKFLNIFQEGNPIMQSAFIEKIRELKPGINPFHFTINLLSMILFPYIGKPVIKTIGQMDDGAWKQFVEERRKLIPLWINAMLEN